jgi:antitoxin component YwqK of YwqJK toxin-antitoxin module
MWGCIKNRYMRLILLLTIMLGIGINSKAQKVITLLPNGDVKSYSSEELKQHKDLSTDGYRVEFSDSGVVIEEAYMKNGNVEGYRKNYPNGILVLLGLHAQGSPRGTHYFWDEKGILKRSVVYECGKAAQIKEY